MANHLKLSSLLSKKQFPTVSEKSAEARIKKLQFDLLRIQQGIWHGKRRAILVFEGFDAAGKGGTIRKVVQKLDPRGVQVHPIGPPNPDDQAKHYLYRFWQKLPGPGVITIFDRSWYGRVLIERVEKLTPKERWKAAYTEIKNFESLLIHDGIDLIKIFLAIHPEEQLQRFEERLKNPYKNWKLTDDDIEAHKRWNKYVKATDDLLRLTHTALSPWHLIAADSKPYAHVQALEALVSRLKYHSDWMTGQLEQRKNNKKLRNELKNLIR